MCGDAYLQCESSFCTGSFCSYDSALQSSLMSRNDNLPGTIIVGHLYNPTRAARLRTDFIQGGNIHAEDSRHAAGIELAGTLHQLSAPPDEPKSVGER